MEADEEIMLRVSKAPPLREDSYHLSEAAHGTIFTLLGIGTNSKKMRPYLQKEHRITCVVVSITSRTMIRMSKIVPDVSMVVKLRIK